MSDFDDIINKLSREFRKYRDKIVGLSGVEAELALRKRLDEFWKEQPWYMQILRKPIMRYAYRMSKKILG